MSRLIRGAVILFSLHPMKRTYADTVPMRNIIFTATGTHTPGFVVSVTWLQKALVSCNVTLGSTIYFNFYLDVADTSTNWTGTWFDTTVLNFNKANARAPASSLETSVAMLVLSVIGGIKNLPDTVPETFDLRQIYGLADALFLAAERCYRVQRELEDTRKELFALKNKK